MHWLYGASQWFAPAINISGFKCDKVASWFSHKCYYIYIYIYISTFKVHG